MTDKQQPAVEGDEQASALPPESAAAHLEALGKGINDVGIIVQGLLDRTPPSKPWQRQLLAQLREVDRHVEILRLAISLDHELAEIHESARNLKRALEVANVQIGGGRADGHTKNALMLAYRSASLVTSLLAPPPRAIR